MSESLHSHARLDGLPQTHLNGYLMREGDRTGNPPSCPHRNTIRGRRVPSSPSPARIIHLKVDRLLLSAQARLKPPSLTRLSPLPQGGGILPGKKRLVDRYGTRKLSARQGRVIERVAQGLKNREIARRLGIGPHVVRNYLSNIYDKIGVEQPGRTRPVVRSPYARARGETSLALSPGFRGRSPRLPVDHLLCLVNRRRPRRPALLSR
jgi:Bacterial regulatory proteins, luxR family